MNAQRVALAAVAACYVIALAAASVIAFAQNEAVLPINPDVTPENIQQTVCVPNWDVPVRPKASVTNRIKFSKMQALGIPPAQAQKYELDHVISLVLGGAPQDPRNLRVQAWYGDAVATPPDAEGLDTQAHLKDALEVRLHKLVCSGHLDLHEAQRCIFNDWRACARAHP